MYNINTNTLLHVLLKYSGTSIINDTLGPESKYEVFHLGPLPVLHRIMEIFFNYVLYRECPLREVPLYRRQSHDVYTIMYNNNNYIIIVKFLITSISAYYRITLKMFDEFVDIRKFCKTKHKVITIPTQRKMLD